ncbi:hypothetical protein N7G274_004146 [Stereocaulon virgatum]|uniref:Uncharacterized protein n=1 Tax=Stereocaulon virgatum TaxID=373712 RepID=A0ABR4AE30_9LECA
MTPSTNFYYFELRDPEPIIPSTNRSNANGSIFLPLLEHTLLPNAAGPSQPDIAYRPDSKKYKSRAKRRLENEQVSKKPPVGFPTNSRSPLPWKSSDFYDEEWVTALTAGDIEEVKQAADDFKKTLDLPLGHVFHDTFPLLCLGMKLRALSAEMHNRRGFPVDDFGRLDCAIAFAGVSSYVGNLRGWQDKTGAVLAHVFDLSRHHVVGSLAYTNDG